MTRDSDKESFLSRWRKQRSITVYIRNLGPYLAQSLGKQRHYPPAQIQRAIEENRYPTDHSCYAVAAFASFDDLTSTNCRCGRPCDYYKLRT